MLGFAAATTTATTAVAQQDPLRYIALDHRIPPQGKVFDGPRYTIPVSTAWWDEEPMFSWIAQNCSTPSDPQWQIERQVGDGAWQVFREGTGGNFGGGVDRVQANTVYRYRLTLTCHKGTTPVTETKLGNRFWIGVVEDNQAPPGPTIGWLGNWVEKTIFSYSGGTTHEVTGRLPAAAIFQYEGIAAAWVTTLDRDSNQEARVVCDEKRDAQGNWVPCAEVDTEDPTPETRTDRPRRVAWSPRFSSFENNDNHEVRVIPSDFDIDVDAFLVVHRA
jgi:hypothetical protein